MAASILIISLAWIGQASQPPVPAVAIPHVEQLPEWQRLALGEPATPPYIQDRGIPTLRDTGVAFGQEKGTIDWMLNGLQTPSPHASR